ncbi:beta strand repeat-containing protein [Schumannella soli]|uniref:Ig-like domain-containing protein n=1 Tax=Schumannella soli TaxID=2590779 RepID=A0A506Y6L3_9MICO|nr:putative Ig domain-containing protein [Schumannella soli]TPW77672.1 hypothetical protein FJ657_03165 [Schumannella soli]
MRGVLDILRARPSSDPRIDERAATAMTTSTPTPGAAARRDSVVSADRFADRPAPGPARRPAARSPRAGRIPFLAAGLAVLLAAAGVVALPADAALAATTIDVSTTADGDANSACTNASVTTTAPNTPVTLRNALCVAGNTASATTIRIGSGVYQLTQGEIAFGQKPGADITLVRSGGGTTEIVGDGQHRVLDIDPNLVGGISVTLHDLTVRGGVDDLAQPGSQGSGGFGGAGIIAGSGADASVAGDSLTLLYVTVTGNTVKAHASPTVNSGGGGVQFIGGSLTITGSTISGNSSNAGPGGGVYYEAAAGRSGESLTVTNSTFSNNTVANASTYPSGGAGISVAGVTGSTASITGSTFTGNTGSATGTGGAAGGAIRLAPAGTSSGAGTATVNSNRLIGNRAIAGAGSQVAVDTTTTALHYNDIRPAAADTAPVVTASPATAVDATQNWWGCATAPGGAGCPTVTAGIPVTPSLVFTADATPATVSAPGARATIGASFVRDSAGTAFAANLLGAFSEAATFSTDTGTLDSASVVLSSGTASAQLTTPSTPGRSTVTVTYGGLAKQVVVTAPQAPAFTSGSSATFTAGTAGSFTITTTGYPTAAITRTAGALPAGLTLTDNGDGTASLAGTPTGSDSVTLSLKADNGSASPATQQLTVTVRQAAAITSAATTTFVTGSAGSFTVTASGSPKPTLTASGALPAGVTFVDNGDGTATLAGTPSAGTGGQYQLSITASNGVGANAVQPFTLTVNAPPTIDGGATASATAATGSAFSRTITTTAGYPTATTITETGALPAGVTFTDNGDGTATLAGTPAALSGGIYSLQISAGNGVGTAATQQLTLTVTQAPAVTSDPSSQSTTVGTSVAFSAAATGYPTPSIQWQKSTDGGITFADITDETSGTLSLTATADLDGAWFRAVFTNGTGSATTTAASLAVGTGPAITSAATATISGDGATQTISITASGKPTPTLALTDGAVPGLVFATGTGTGTGAGTATLTGVPTSAGEFTLKLSASNEHGTGTQTLVVTVQQKTAITSPSGADFAVGSPGSFTVTTDGGYPTPASLELDGDVPEGLTFVDDGDGTGTLSGTPATGTGGVASVDVVATTAPGHVARQTLTITVGETAAVTGPARVDATAGVPFSATVTTAGGYPTAVTLTAGPLPAGVDFVDEGDGTGTLSGTVAEAGSSVITITATNATGATTAQVTLVVAEPAVVPLPLILPTLTGSLTGVPAQLEQGQSFTVSGSGFAPHAPITLGLYSTPTTLATVEADETGAFTQTLTVPADFAVGDHTVVATGIGADGAARYLGAPTTVSAADVDPGDGGTTPGGGAGGGTGSGGSGATGSGSGSGSGLAATGVGEAWMLAAALAVLALLAGIRLVVARRRAA